MEHTMSKEELLRQLNSNLNLDSSSNNLTNTWFNFDVILLSSFLSAGP